jgi:hypothetical protein
MITKDDLQRESDQSQKYALRFVAALTISAACCGSFVVVALARHDGPSQPARVRHQSIQVEKSRDGSCGVNRRLFDEAPPHHHAFADRIGVRQIRQ